MFPSRWARSFAGLAALAVCFFLGGGEVAAQTTLRSLQVGDRTRTYYLHVPPTYTGKEPVPLVLVLHGWAGNGRAIETASGFSARSDQAGFLVAYPNAMNFPAAWQYGWGSSNGDPQEEHGLVPCLFALAHALRGENDKLAPQGLPSEVKRLAAVREYLANQVSGLAAFWRIQVPEGPPR